MNNLFFAHKISMPDAAIDRTCAVLAARIGAEIDQTVKVVPGRDDYKQRFTSCGGWLNWSLSVGAGDDYEGGPLFSGILVPDLVVGKATMQIIEAAISAKRAVLFVDDALRLFEVYGIQAVDENDWKAGWAIEYQKTPLI